MFRIVIDMNVTMWNSTDETLFLHQSFVNLLLGGVTLFVHGYAIFISYAIYDYQGTIHKQSYHTFHVLKDFCQLPPASLASFFQFLAFNFT